MTTRHFTTPEDLLSIASDVPAGYPIDALTCAIGRADSILCLVSGQFDGTGGDRYADPILANILWAVRGELALISKLVAHGDATERDA